MAASSSNAPRVPVSLDDDDEEESGEAWHAFPDTYHAQACALHAMAEAIAVVDMELFAGTAAEWVEMAQEKLIMQTGQELNLPMLTSKLVSTLSYYSKNGASSKWPKEVADVIKTTHSIHVQKLEHGTCKDEIRTNSRYKCHLCGTHENNCMFAVHLAGGPAYDATKWVKSDAGALLKSWQDFIAFYGDVVESRATAKDDRAYDKVYTGIIVPGETCLKRLLLAIKSQNVVMEIVYDAHTHLVSKMQAEDFDAEAVLPCSLFNEQDVQQTASLIELIHRAQANACVPEVAEDGTFWKITLDRFARNVLGGSPARVDTPRFLRSAYERMTASLGRPCGECDEEEEEQEEEDGVDDEEDEGEDRMSEFIEDDEDDEIAASSSRKIRKRTRVVYDEEDDEAGQEQEEEVPPRTGATPRDQQRLLAAARQGPSSQTARGLRAHPGNALHSRRETLDDLIRIARSIDDLGHKSCATFTASVLASCLQLHEASSAADPRRSLAKNVHVAIQRATALAAQLATSNALDAVQCAAVLSAAVCVIAEFRSPDGE